LPDVVKRFDFFTGPYFPKGFMLIGGILLPFGILLAFVQAAIGITLIVVGLITTTHYRLQIDQGKRHYREYVWFLGLKIGKPVSFETIEYFFIKTSRESQTMNSGRIATSTITKLVYDGYLRFSEHDKVHVATKDKRETLVSKITPMSKALNVPIMDYTQPG
jgi:hypothetical protein